MPDLHRPHLSCPHCLPSGLKFSSFNLIDAAVFITLHAQHIWHFFYCCIMALSFDSQTKNFSITTVIVALQSLHVGETFLMVPTLLGAFPAQWKDKEASHGEVCEHMLGGMIMQTRAHTQQTWSFAIFLPTGLLGMTITLLSLLHILTYNTITLSKSRCNFLQVYISGQRINH